MEFSHLSIIDKITNGWEEDIGYMRFADNWLLRKLERVSLELGIRNPESEVWDIVSYISYSLAAIKARQTKKHYLLDLERLL